MERDYILQRLQTKVNEMWNINFEELSQNKYLTSDIVDKYINRLDIPLVLANIKIDEDVIKKHITKISRYLK